mmetsp:Transcript_16692/g.43044  ORF Transcript_16692/g.43044 Transcript_16692/m.43044 type:complete len:138 (+) Transcript_16692:99-512(+)
MPPSFVAPLLAPPAALPGRSLAAPPPATPFPRVRATRPDRAVHPVRALAGKGFGKKPSTPPRGDADDGPRPLKGKKAPMQGCPTCNGRGAKACAFCEGTGAMVGFTRTTKVPCIPCDATGRSRRKCPDCNGLGFLDL